MKNKVIPTLTALILTSNISLAESQQESKTPITQIKTTHSQQKESKIVPAENTYGLPLNMRIKLAKTPLELNEKKLKKN